MRMMAMALLLALSGCGSTSQPAPDTGTTSVSDTPGELAPGAPADFAVCAGCHTIITGQNAIGPSLRGVVGRKAGSLPNYAYSAAVKNSGIIWTPARLDTWLSGPMTMVPGTRMSFGGYSDPKQRRAVIAYLKTLK